MFDKAFTFAEANFLIPTLDGVLTEIDERMERVRRAVVGLQVLDVLWGDKIVSKDNPDHAEGQSYRLEIGALMKEIEEIVEREIESRGLRFPPGGLEHGLIDFPTTWQGRWVYLCWRRGEAVIEAWHEIESGFAGRRELTLQQRREMGRDDVNDGDGTPKLD